MLVIPGSYSPAGCRQGDIRKLAQHVIAAGKGESAMMKDWLAKNAK